MIKSKIKKGETEMTTEEFLDQRGSFIRKKKQNRRIH